MKSQVGPDGRWREEERVTSEEAPGLGVCRGGATRTTQGGGDIFARREALVR